MHRKNLLILLCFLNLAVFGQTPDAVVKGLEKAAADGELSAQIHLGDCYYNGTLGCKKNIDKARYYYQLASNQGDAEALYKLARLLRTVGLNTEEEAKNYFKVLQSSADKGYGSAQYVAGMELQEMKMPECFKYLKMAVDNNVSNAIYPLGVCYMQGLGCNVDLKKAIECFEKGKESVYEEAYVMDMAHCYYKLNDYPNAKTFIDKGISLGSAAAHQVAATMCMTGNGYAKNTLEALKHINIAISKEPNIPNYKDIKGMILLDQGNFQDAKTVWEDLEKNHNEYALTSESFFCNTMRTEGGENVDLNIANGGGNNENTFVVIIANENYRRETSVPYALNDGTIFNEYCKKTLCIPESNIKLFQDATYNDIKYGVNWLTQIANACNGNARVIFYYAGHGIPAEDQTTSFLLPADGYGSDTSTGYDLRSLYEALGSIKAKHVVVFLDACFSGAKRDGGMLSSARGVAIKPKEIKPSSNMVVISAAQGDETAYPYTKQKHGMFTYYLLKKLQETKGEASLGEIYKYVSSQVAKQSILENGKSQTPNVLSGIQAKWELIRLR